MITNNEQARRENTFREKSIKRKVFDKTIQQINEEENGNHCAYFDNFVAVDKNWIIGFRSLFPIFFEFIIYFGIMAYLYSLETALVGIIMPVSAMSVFYIILIILHISNFKRIKRR